MATIKGQNIRLRLNNKCIALANSCQLHLAAQTEDSSTKDDTGDWASNEVTGFSWDASVDALVMADNITAIDTEEETTVAYDSDTDVTVPAYSVIVLGGSIESGEIGEAGIYINNAAVSHAVTDASNDSEVYYINASDEAVTVTLLNAEALTASYYYVIRDMQEFTTSSIMELMQNKTVIDCEITLTQGEQNREAIDDICQGTAIISDVSVTAQNRANSTYTVQLTGTGTLTL